jgi:NTE family protein
MKKNLALVLGGGGARGALQVGACRALFEAGYKPDLIVGTSIGAANAAGLALWGVNLEGVTALEKAYQTFAESEWMDTPGRLVWHTLTGRPFFTGQKARDVLIEFGIGPDLHFDQFEAVRLGLVSADMSSGERLIYGLEPGQSVLEGVLNSVAVPPWFAPIENEEQLIVDGGAFSNLPIEPALNMGATEIIALDLSIPPSLSRSTGKISQLEKAIASFNEHERYLELALAEARGVPVHYLRLKSDPPTPMWDFSTYHDLIAIGYETARDNIPAWQQKKRLGFKEVFQKLIKKG